MEKRLWRFTDSLGSFKFPAANKIKSLYFPLCNERLMSSLTPDLHGDIKSGQNSFLLLPVSRIDLTTSQVSRNFWIYIDKGKAWSATGVSKNLKEIEHDHFNLEAGLLWHKIERENKRIGLKTEILSFVPATGEPIEVMQVKVTNINSKKIKFIPTAAIPIFARGANNLRDHRHVTSLLQRITLHKFGITVKPTLVFDESGHKPNKDIYFVLGWDKNFRPPKYLYPTQEMFHGEEGDLEAPSSVLKNTIPGREGIQGKEAMGALRFRPVILKKGQSQTYIILMGISQNKSEIKVIISKFNGLDKVADSLKRTKDFWITNSQRINVATGDSDFDNWFRWVSIQPALRKIFGCSFLPDFDYGKGGRGWRDLWQDCLGLILSNPEQVRKTLVNNFSGVRIDGSNATIIGKKEGEFIADRNNISRVWMDHGIWPLITLDPYLNETGDSDILFEEVPYFRNHEINRTKAIDYNWNSSYGIQLKTVSGKVYKGSVLEHLLVENLVQFFNVGSHNCVRLEGADWNDGLDMAKEKGESVTFSAMYAKNLLRLAEILLKINKKTILIAKELRMLLNKVNYNDFKAKQKVLEDYFKKTQDALSGDRVSIDVKTLASDLKSKADWLMRHLRKNEWLKEGFFNGYYDNRGRRVEGKSNNLIRMTLASQVFPIMSGAADDLQIKRILKSTEKYLFDRKLKSFHLNTDFREEQYNLGRAFSFVYGDKENGAIFNHMVVMFANALYKRNYVKEGWQVLSSIYNMAMDTQKSKIYPCLPEYFNLEGRGMYSYLTGSASWFVLTILTEVFGVKGKDGDLLIEPKLAAEQFKERPVITINKIFSGRNLCVNFSNHKKLDWGKYKIIKVSLNSQKLAFPKASSILISRKILQKLAQHTVNAINITLG